ncbi:MAG: PspC domain-containing protein [Candidatus Binatia bacterium]
MSGSRKCPFCAEEVSAEAARCRYCRSRLKSFDPESWHRDQPERRIAGVAAAVADGLALPLSLVRLGFLVLTFVHLLGPMLYAALWLVIPFEPGAPPLLARLVDMARDAVDFALDDRDEASSADPDRRSRRRSSVREDVLS